MKKLLLGLLLMGACSSAFATYGVGVTGSGSGSPGTATMSGSVASGTVVVVGVVSAGAACSGWTVSDTINTGNYTLLSSTTGACFFWKIANATGTPTLSIGGSGGSYLNLTAAQLTGWVGTPTADATLANPFTATSATIGASPVTTTHNNEFLLATAYYPTTYATGTPSGWTVLGGGGLCSSCVAYAFEATSGTTDNFSQTLNASVTWNAITAGIYDSASSTTGVTVVVNQVPVSQWIYMGASAALPRFPGGLYKIACDATAGAVTATLPTAVGNYSTYELLKVDAGGNACKFATTASQTINGSTPASITSQWNHQTVASDNANWDQQ
jgi:hypothetical protein